MTTANTILKHTSRVQKIKNAYEMFQKDPQKSVASCRVRMTGLIKNWQRFESIHYQIFAANDLHTLMTTHSYFLDIIYDEVDEQHLVNLSLFQASSDRHPPSTDHTQDHNSQISQNVS